jgi:hypothetical protein
VPRSLAAIRPTRIDIYMYMGELYFDLELEPMPIPTQMDRSKCFGKEYKRVLYARVQI